LIKTAKHKIVIIWFLASMVNAFGQFPAQTINKAVPVEILGIRVSPHTCIDPIFYKASDPFEPEMGALVQIVIRNAGKEPFKFRLLFNGIDPSDPRLIQSEGKPAYNVVSNIKNPDRIPEWTWCEMPDQKAYKGKSYELGAGKTDVYTYNSYRNKWGENYTYTISIVDPEGEILDSVRLTNKPNIANLEFISFIAEDKESIFPDSVIVHISNNTSEEFKIKKMRLYCPAADLINDPTNGLILFMETDQLVTFTRNNQLPSKGWSGFTCKTGQLPLVRGLLEVILEKSGKETSLWASLMFRKEQFNIGSGWLGYTNESDSIFTAPISHESFLKTLKRMHINVAHTNDVNKYIAAELQPRFTLKNMLNEFPVVYEHPEIFNTEKYIRNAERIDCLGEPNWSRTAMESYLITKRYMLSETYPAEEWHIPTSVDHSMPQRVRFFSGLTDYPSFDNYRVTAPSDDNFRRYSKRWADVKNPSREVVWGAPLETLGDITRTVHAMNKPKPIAAWSQNVHYNWDTGKEYRTRLSPTQEEIYSQAYQILANGVTSLYWYSLEANSILLFRDAINITGRIGREIKMLEPLYISGAAYYHERKNLDGNYNTPDADLNVIVTPEAALLFVNDLTYTPNTEKASASFVFKPRKIENFFFPLPEYIEKPFKVFRVDADGIYSIDYTDTKGGITINEDSIFICGVYIVAMDEPILKEIREKRLTLIGEEESLNFDPGNNDDDFYRLRKEMQSKPE